MSNPSPTKKTPRREDTKYYGVCIIDQSSIRCTCEDCSPGNTWQVKVETWS